MGTSIQEALKRVTEQLTLDTHIPLPEHGCTAEEILAHLHNSKANDPDFHSNQLFGLVYPTSILSLENVIKEANNLYLWGNALNMPAFPNLTRMGFEVVSMAGSLLHQPSEGGGCITSGGTESIMMSMLVNREIACSRGVEKAQILAPYSAHPAFAKAAKYLDMEYVTFPYNSDYKASVAEAKRRLTPDTAVIVGSAMTFSHSVIDPIRELAALAAEHNIGCHVDACVGGFILPFLEHLGYEIEPWDFRIPGVTQISLDLHKYGYAPKGASIILHRDMKYMEHQFFLFDDWPSGLYGTPAIAGARPANNIVTAWAALQHLGIDGYLELAQQVMTVTEKVQSAIEDIDELYVVGCPVGPMLAFAAHDGRTLEIGKCLVEKGWHLDLNTDPVSLHVMFSPAHHLVINEFLADLRMAVSKCCSPIRQDSAC